jgi:hypothetical protein
LFYEFQQKEVSAFMKKLWYQDMFKGKWTILAKTYSTIRDTYGKEKCPLNRFLDIACPIIGVININTYLETFCWEVTTNLLDEKILSQTSDPGDFDLTVTQSNLSEANLVQVCEAAGYIPRGAVKQLLGDMSTQNLMVVAPTYIFRKTKEEFHTLLWEDTKAAAAEIFGIDVDHPFLEMSDAPFVGDEFSDKGDGNLLQLIQSFNQEAVDETPEQEPEVPYEYTDSSLDFFEADETVLPIEDFWLDDTYAPLNISNPQVVDEWMHQTPSE